MENKFKAGDTAYLRVQVESALGTDETYDYVVSHIDHGNESVSADCVMAGQLYTAEELADENCIDWQAKYNEYNEKAEAKIRELATRLNGMAESLREAQAKAVSLNSALKEQDSAYADVVSKNAALTKQNRELEEMQSAKKGEVKHWRGMYMHMKERCNEYKRAADNLMVERDRADDELALTRIMNMALAEKIERLQNNG